MRLLVVCQRDEREQIIDIDYQVGNRAATLLSVSGDTASLHIHIHVNCIKQTLLSKARQHAHLSEERGTMYCGR